MLKLWNILKQPVFSVIICGTMLINTCIYAENDSNRVTDEKNIEEVFIVGERFEIDTAIAFDRLTDSNSRGAKLYKQGKYKEALPYLLVGAKTGFKMSQARLGAIYIGGLGGVQKNLEQGIGWLGVASEPITSPEIRMMWKRVLSNVSEESRGKVSAIVDKFIATYGRKATRTACEMTANTKSFVARLECTLDDEYYLFASDDHKTVVGCMSGVRSLCVAAGLNHLGGFDGTMGSGGPF